MKGEPRLSVAKNPHGGKDDARADSAPLVWALIGDKAGDNAAVLALAEAVGWPVLVKRLVYNGLYRVPNIVMAQPFSLVRARGDPLAPPWPDLVIAVGRRSVPVARWLGRASSGRARLVHLGRPRAPYAWFDLIVTTPQYALPARPNVVTIPLPLTAPRQAADGEAFAGLPRPRVALLAGGDAGPWRLGDPARLGRAASALARRHGGSLLVTTSRRTGAVAAEALIGAVDAPARIHRHGQGANPYPAILAGADAFIVTADSVSMMADAAATGRPLLLFEAAYRPTPGQRVADAARALPGYDTAVDLGLIARPRALDRVAAALIGAGHARPLAPDDDLAPPAVAYDAAGIAARVVARVRALVEGA